MFARITIEQHSLKHMNCLRNSMNCAKKSKKSILTIFLKMMFLKITVIFRCEGAFCDSKYKFMQNPDEKADSVLTSDADLHLLRSMTKETSSEIDITIQ